MTWLVDRRAHPAPRGRPLLIGKGRFVDDIALPACCMRRSCAARIPMRAIRAIDARDALALPGVHAVLTLDDLAPVAAAAAHAAPLQFRHAARPVLAVRARRRRGLLCRRADRARGCRQPLSSPRTRPRWSRSTTTCCRRSRTAARLARRTRRRSVASSTPTSSPPTRSPIGDADAAFAKAAHVFHEELWQHRGAAHPIEGRGILAEYRASDDMLTVWASTQKAHDLFQSLTALLDLDENRLRVATPDVGGGFGPKLCVYPEDVAVVAAAKLLRRSIKWIEDRREHFTNAAQERDQYWSIDIAVDADGKVLGIRGRLLHDLGAYALQDVNMPYNSASMMTGPYMVPALAMDVMVAATNKTPVSSVRGAGYPQAAFAMERLMDRVARELRLDRAEAAPPQSHPAREDALQQAAQGALRRQHAVRQRRLSGLPGRGACGRAVGRLPAAAGRGARAAAAISASGSRTASRAPAAGRSSPAWCGCRTPAASRCSPAPPRSGRASAPRWRRSAPASSACGREDITVVPGDTGGVSLGLGAFASRQTVTAGSSVLLAARAVAGQGQEAREPCAGGGRARSRIRRRRGARGRRAAALRSSSASCRAFSRARRATAFRPTSSPGSRPTSTCAPMRSPMPMPVTSPRSRSTSRPAGCTILRYVALQDSGVLINPDDGRRPGAGRHRARHRQRAARMDGL